MNVAEPGFQTTEFWIAVIAAFIGLLEVFNIVHITDAQRQAVIGFATMIIPIAFYIVSRGLRKNGTNDPVTMTKALTAAGKVDTATTEAKTAPPPPQIPIVPTR